ncbi:MAG: adenylyltransferase/cytidyltransferase family protein [Alphaproteobacteria bacterium]|nr:adenylyltransferase/cytidyltransferase family protein [Alphaproteobacteria bacterium]
MKKVITYGTYDLLHFGHIRLLERAKALGDYLIVGVTSDSFDLTRGKINAQQSLMERIEAVRATGLADEIIVEEYEGQKIDDIKRYDVDIFTVGSDWEGKFDYLEEFCQVVYLDRTEGISSSEIRSEKRDLRIGLVGNSGVLNKFERESHFVNGVSISGLYSTDVSELSEEIKSKYDITDNLEDLLSISDAVYIVSHPSKHYEQIKKALLADKHVLCESPITINISEYEELRILAKERNLQLMDSIKTAYSTAYNRMLVLAKSGKIGNIVSVDSICTSLSDLEKKVKDGTNLNDVWNSICAWGPTAMLPIFQLLGTNYVEKQTTSLLLADHFDSFSRGAMVYPNAVASFKVGKGVKSEGELVISGTKGYIYVPAPWWKTDYFEIRYENPSGNKRYFYQLDGEGIRYEILSFLKAIQIGKDSSYISEEHSKGIVCVINDFYDRKYYTIE